MRLARRACHLKIISALLAVLWPTLSFQADAADTGSPKRPNIVLILADDVGSEVLGCYGGRSYQTPNLDTLARTGTRFTHCYSMPVCHPTRIAIMTGQYPFRTKAGWGTFPADVRTIAHVLKDAGYATAVAGKWQLVLQGKQPNHPKLLGFDESCLFGWHEGPRYHKPYIWKNGRRWPDVEQPDVFGPEVYCDFLIDFITRNSQGPFFAYYSMALCHEISDDFLPVPPPAPDGHYLSFAEMVTAMDTMVGRLVSALDRLGVRENTLILFTTDNGSPTRYLTNVVQQNDGKILRRHEPVVSMRDGKEIRGGKGQLTDAGTRVPLIANLSGVTSEGKTNDDLIDFTDLLPTFAELAQTNLPEGQLLDGRSFAPQLRGLPGKPRPWVYCERKDNTWWVRTKNWKLYNNGQLFAMDVDPQEEKPVLPGGDTAEFAAARKKLQVAMDRLR